MNMNDLLTIRGKAFQQPVKPVITHEAGEKNMSLFVMESTDRANEIMRQQQMRQVNPGMQVIK